MKVTEKKIKIETDEICPFARCNKKGKHEHSRYDDLGWDLAWPGWNANVSALFFGPVNTQPFEE